MRVGHLACNESLPQSWKQKDEQPGGTGDKARQLRYQPAGDAKHREDAKKNEYPVAGAAV